MANPDKLYDTQEEFETAKKAKENTPDNKSYQKFSTSNTNEESNGHAYPESAEKLSDKKNRKRICLMSLGCCKPKESISKPTSPPVDCET